MINELYARLNRLQVSVQKVDGKLEVRAAKGVLTKELLDEIKCHKNDLIAFLDDYKKKKQIYPRIKAENKPAILCLLRSGGCGC